MGSSLACSYRINIVEPWESELVKNNLGRPIHDILKGYFILKKLILRTYNH